MKVALCTLVLTLFLYVTSAARAERGSQVVEAIRYVFGPYADAALRVAWCESRYSVWASNGQYVNLFQMGYAERRLYGWHEAGSPAWQAALAAYRYFVASGKDWSPWACRP